MAKNQFSQAIKDQEKLNSLIEANSKSMGSFASAAANAAKFAKQITIQQNKLNELEKELNNGVVEHLNITKKLKDKSLKISTDEIAKLKSTQANLQQSNKLLAQQVNYHKNLINSYQKQQTLINKSIVNLKTVGNVIKNEIGGALKSGWKDLMSMDKAVRTTQLSMGILTTQAEGFQSNIYKTSIKTQMLGANAKDLAGYQKEYSNEIGRSLILSDQGLMAMTEIAKGTMLGAEGAAQLASSMEGFGINAERSRDLVQETLNSAQKMGVNSEVATKKLLNNLKMANKYHFKGGVASIKEMAVRAAKFKLDMQDIAGFADNLFTPEGAIDASAQLQVLGGEWAKLADPFKLMYQARHDIDGLHKSVIEATKGVFQFNKTTGEFEASGMEMHRLREVAKATGMDYEVLANSAKEVAKYSMIKPQISPKISPEYHDFLTSVSQLDKNGNIQLQLYDNGKIITKISELDNTILKRLTEEKESLKTRAKEAQAFDEVWGNLKNTFKATLLPALNQFALGIREPLMKFTEWLQKSDILSKMSKFGEQVGSIATAILKFAVNNPWTTLLGLGLFEASKWIVNGVSLGIGFNSVAGGAGKGGIVDTISKLFNGKAGGFGASMKNGGSIGGNMLSKGAGAGGLISGLIGGYNEYQENKDSGLTGGQQAGKIATRAGGAGVGAWVGGALGSLIMPGAGTIGGAALGGYIGDMIGDYLGEGIGSDNVNPNPNNIKQDFIARPGEKAQPFSSKDTLVGFKPGGPLEKAVNKSNDVDNSVKNVQISFAPLKIEGVITLQSGNSSTKIDISNDPILARELSSIIQKELRKSVGGGILNPNPTK